MWLHRALGIKENTEGYMIDAHKPRPEWLRGLFMTLVIDLSIDAGNSHPDSDINNTFI